MKAGYLGICCAAAACFNAHAQPTITEDPQSRTAPPGAPVQFRVNAIGAEPLRYQWQFNGQDIPNARRQGLTVYATPSRAGTYTAVVIDGSGFQKSSRPANLEVQPRPVIVVQPRKAIVPVHGTAVFDVRVNDSGPYTSVQWWHHSPQEPHHPIPESPVYDVHSFHFEIPDCTDNGTYNGLYWITVSNRVGGTVSRRVSLTVVGPPRLTAEPQDRTVRQGGTASFSVAIAPDAAGPKTRQWYKDGEILPGRIGRALTIFNAQPDDQGFYYCVVSSMGGATRSYGARLTVY